MDVNYQEVTRFKYEANLLYVQGILSQNHIAFRNNQESPFLVSVKPEDHAKASGLIKDLNLDESEVNENSDGYIAGYEEWADKRFVNGYFTGGNIPRWMFDKKYARWFGPVNMITGLFMLAPLMAGLFNLQGVVQFLIGVVNIICGVLLTIRGFKREAAL